MRLSLRFSSSFYKNLCIYFFAYRWLCTPALLVERLSFFHRIEFASLSKISWMSLRGSIYGSFHVALILYNWSVRLPFHQWHNGLITVKSGRLSPHTLFFFFQNCISILVLFFSVQILKQPCLYLEKFPGFL